MLAVLLAGGGADPRDPLYSLSRGSPKALLPIAGRPLAQRVLDAAEGCAAIDRVALVGPGPDSGLRCAKALVHVPDSGGLIANLRAGVAADLERGGSPSDPVIVLASDVPALRAEMLDWLAAEAADPDCDLWYCAIRRGLMESRYPGSGRSYLRFKDEEVCGGDVMALRPSAFSGAGGVWEELAAGRKSALRLAATLGPRLLLDFLLRRRTVAEAALEVGARLGIRARALLSPWAELGMDADKPYQFAMLEADLRARGLGFGDAVGAAGASSGDPSSAGQPPV